jgi:hypothetical protein
MGDMGDYQFLDQNGAMFGAVMTRAPGGPPPMWGAITSASPISATKHRRGSRRAAASPSPGPVDVPGGDRIIVAEIRRARCVPG